MAAISGVPVNQIRDDNSESLVVKQPGALVMAIQAVCCYLLFMFILQSSHFNRSSGHSSTIAVV